MTFHHPSAPRLTVEGIRRADGSVQVCLIGELDMDETDRLQAGIAEVVRRHAPAPVRIDATRLTFLDSAGIRALLTCRKIVQRTGSEMSIPSAHPNVFQVLQITGLLGVFGVVEQATNLLDEPHG